MTAVNFGALVAGTYTTAGGKTWYCDGTRWIPVNSLTPSVDFIAKYVCVGGETTIDFSDIPQTFTDLVLVWNVRDTAAGTVTSTTRLKFNADGTAGNYSSSARMGSANGAAVAALVTANASGAALGFHPNDGNTAGVTAGGSVIIPNYTSTTNFKRFVGSFGENDGSNGECVFTQTGRWLSMNAVNRLTIGTDGSGFKAGSAITVYGKGRASVPYSSSGVVTVSETAPVAPGVGDLWLCTAVGSFGLYVYFNDGDTSQWVATWQANGAADVVSAQPGSGGVVIPGLQASPDIRVAGTNDDEFDATVSSGAGAAWTTFGSPTSHNVNTAAKSHYYVKAAAGASLAWGGIYKAVPAMPFTVTAKLAGIMMRGNYNAAGLFIGESPPGKLEVVSVTMDSSTSFNGPCIEHVVATNPTTFGSLVASQVGIDAPAYFKIVVTSSTNVSFYFSTDGVLWRPTAIARNPGFTVGVVGLGCKSESASYTAEAMFDWIRFS